MTDGGTAFPADNGAYQTGMTLRDYFAATVAPGLLYWHTQNGQLVMDYEISAEAAYRMADAMLLAREERKS
jgi:hypothetical protein